MILHQKECKKTCTKMRLRALNCSNQLFEAGENCFSQKMGRVRYKKNPPLA
jgi:hypothetical protein